MHHRILRIVGAIGLAIALTAGSLASVALAGAAPLLVSGTSYAPTVISPGGIAVFHLKAENDPQQTSNIAQLYMRENSHAGVYGYADPNPNPWCTPTTTPSTDSIQCTFGSLSPGQSVEFTVALTAPSTGVACPAGSAFTTCWHPDFEFSTNGFTTTGKKSRGGSDPTFHEDFYIPLASGTDTSNAAGTYAWDSSHLSVHDGLKLGQSNRQATSVTSPITGISVGVQDGDSNPADLGCVDGTQLCPATFFGEISIVEVGGDELITNQADCPAGQWVDASASASGESGCAFPAVIQYYRPGVNPNQVNGVYHNWTDTSGFHQEWIDHECASPSAPGPITPCFYAEKLGAQDLQITVWFFHNGRVMTY